MPISPISGPNTIIIWSNESIQYITCFRHRNCVYSNIKSNVGTVSTYYAAICLALPNPTVFFQAWGTLTPSLVFLGLFVFERRTRGTDGH